MVETDGTKMKERAGAVFSIGMDNPPVPGCTVSREVYQGDGAHVLYFSLADGTDISPELYPSRKILLMAAGGMEVLSGDGESELRAGGRDCFVAPAEAPLGIRAQGLAVYTEITLRRTTEMNNAVKVGEAFKLGDLVPYQKGRIVNMDVISDPKLKFVVMSFDEGTGLTEHSAPGEAMIFALEGQGVIGYEGTDHEIKAGENFVFAKGGRHSVTAKGQFKMALLLTLE